MPYGGGVRALEHHSESEEQFYAHIPGLKMVVPSGPRNARALLAAAIRDPDPVIFFEAKALYHAAKEEVPDEPETMPLGQARVDREGRDLTLVAYGAMVRVAREAADTARGGGRRADRDHRSPHGLAPRSRGPGGLGGQDGARGDRPRGAAELRPRRGDRRLHQEGAFLSLEAPIRRVTAYDVPFPGFAREKANVPDAARVVAAARETLAF